MMAPGRIRSADCQARDRIETALAILIGMQSMLDELALRNRQAMRRSPLVSDVLDPSNRRIAKIQTELKALQAELNRIWDIGQSERWQENVSEDHS